MAKVAKSRRPQAERAAEWVCHKVFGCILTRRALRTKFAKVDFFGCDVIGLKPDGSKLWIQVTTGQSQAVLVRRKKLEPYPWHDSDDIMVWQLVERQSVANPRRKDWSFRVWRLGEGREWMQEDPIEVKSEWFKAFKDVEKL